MPASARMIRKSNTLNNKAIRETSNEWGIIHTLHNISVRKEMVCCLSNVFDIHFKLLALQENNVSPAFPFKPKLGGQALV